MDSMLERKYIILGRITVKNPEADTTAYLLRELMYQSRIWMHIFKRGTNQHDLVLAE